MRLAVAGHDIAGLSLALRLRIKGHEVVAHEHALPSELAEHFTVIAPFRDLFLKSGHALEDCIGLHEVLEPFVITVDGIRVELPPAGAQVPAIARALGDAAGRQWSRLLSDAADAWSLIRTDTFTPQSSLQRYLRSTVTDSRLHQIVTAMSPVTHPKQISNAAIIYPYLRQTFGVWQFDGGLANFERVLRARCTDLGIELSHDAPPNDALSVSTHFDPMFSAPRRLFGHAKHSPPSTQRLGLPFVGMAAEAIANRIGRAKSE